MPLGIFRLQDMCNACAFVFWFESDLLSCLIASEALMKYPLPTKPVESLILNHNLQGIHFEDRWKILASLFNVS